MTDQHPSNAARPPEMLSVLVASYNEAPRLRRAIELLVQAPAPRNLRREIVIVDDGSRDGSFEIATALAAEYRDVRVFRHGANHGKGAALRTAMREARGDVLLVHDADLEYDPRDHAHVLAPLLDGLADAVIGSRFLGQTHRVLYYWHAVANRIITMASNMFTNLNLTDIECCIKAMRREVASQIEIEENRFGVEPELVAKIARVRIGGQPARVYETAVTYAGRTYAEGKKITWRDGVWALWCIVRYGLGPHASPPESERTLAHGDVTSSAQKKSNPA